MEQANINTEKPNIYVSAQSKLSPKPKPKIQLNKRKLVIYGLILLMLVFGGLGLSTFIKRSKDDKLATDDGGPLQYQDINPLENSQYLSRIESSIPFKHAPPPNWNYWDNQDKDSKEIKILVGLHPAGVSFQNGQPAMEGYYESNSKSVDSIFDPNDTPCPTYFGNTNTDNTDDSCLSDYEPETLNYKLTNSQSRCYLYKTFNEKVGINQEKQTCVIPLKSKFVYIITLNMPEYSEEFKTYIESIISI